jgi:hypothetical protein
MTVRFASEKLLMVMRTASVETKSLNGECLRDSGSRNVAV